MNGKVSKKSFSLTLCDYSERGLWSMTAIAFLMHAIHLIGTLTV